MALPLNQHRSIITQAVIAKFSDENEPQQGLAAFFPVVTTDTKLLSIEVERNLQPIAVDVQRCTDPVLNTFSKSTEKLFEPPFYNEMFDYTACQRYDVTFGRGNTPTKIDSIMLITDAISKVKKLKNKILRAIELQRAQVLQTGVVTLKNGDSIDYRRKAASMEVLAGTAKWDQPTTANPEADLARGMQFLRDEGLSSGSHVNAIFGTTALANFLNIDKINKKIEWRRADRISLNMPQFDNVTGMAFHGQFAAGDYIVNIWTYSGSYTKPGEQTQTRYIDTNNVICVAEDFVGKTAFAGVPAIMGEGDSKYIAPQRGEFYVRDIIDQVKMAWNFIVNSAPLVIPVSVDRIWSMKTA